MNLAKFNPLTYIVAYFLFKISSTIFVKKILGNGLTGNHIFVGVMEREKNIQNMTFRKNASANSDEKNICREHQ